MAREIELKFDMTPAGLRQLELSSWLRRRADGRKPDARKSERLVSVYFDTARGRLRKRGLSLRLRRHGTAWVQTIKSGAAGTMSGRGEWEAEIAGDKPDLRHLDDTPLAELAADLGRKQLAARLKPVFETDVSRLTVPVKVKDGTVELAIDQGNIRIGDQVQPIHEIELELKAGDPAALIETARQLADEFPLRYSVMSKAERGQALVGKTARETVGEAAHSEPVRLDAAADCAGGFQAIGLSCLRQIMRNEAAVMKGDAEGVHQMRVGLRRLRAAISLFKDLLRDAETQDIKARLKWLTEELGPARNYDVFVKEGISPLQETTARQQEVAQLKTMAEADRKDRFQRAKAAVGSEEFRRITCATALWLCGGDWLRSDDALLAGRRSRPLEAFVAEIMDRRLHKIVKRARQLDRLDQRRRHKLRIAVKKLRYAAEFFATLFPEAEAQRCALGRMLKRLQGALGKLNDFATHAGLADRVMESDRGNRQAAFAMGLLSGREEAKSDALLAAAAKASRKLARLPGFWD